MPRAKATAKAPAKPKKKPKHGGKREGAGRKVSTLPDEVREHVGVYPYGQPFKIARWYQDLIGGLLDQVLDGEKGLSRLLSEVKSASAAANRIIPLDVMHAAAKRLDDDDKEIKETDAGGKVTSRKDDHVAKRTPTVRRATP